MEVIASDLGKRYAYTWILRSFNMHIKSSSTVGISGPNGSGKSTLLKILAGYLPPTTGKIEYVHDQQTIDHSSLYKWLSWVAPYTDLIQEYTMKEMFKFHFTFKPPRISLSYEQFKDIVQLKNQKGKPIQLYSSGMNQRLQLALAILSDTPLLILDEPTSYLDQNAKEWMMQLIAKHMDNRTVIIASNDPDDFQHCENIIHI